MEHTYQYLLFDLDGTLTDSGPGICQSVAYALEQLGIPVGEAESLRRFVGPPLDESFQRWYNVPKEQISEAIRLFRVRYNEGGGVFENSPYPGIEGFLEELREAGKTLLVATSKPLPTALRVLEHFKLEPYFTGIYGGGMKEDGGECRKADIVARAIAACGENAEGKILMIGDRENDVFGAHQNGIPCAGVLWGYGSRKELEAAGAEYIAADYEELKRIVQLSGAGDPTRLPAKPAP